ncbi:MAG: MAPEG family protein [Rubrobacteraceae bacterium]|nr:MAPEG family protein [Rubrobacteraceae bacterium]
MPGGALVSVELRMLTFSVVLGIVQIIAASHAASLQRGYRWTASPRDEKVEPLRGVAGRLDRALRNFLETFPLFAAVVLAAQLTGTHDALTEWGARLYFWGRLAYVPLYAAGVALIRSLVWNIPTIGIGLVVIALLLGWS